MHTPIIKEQADANKLVLFLHGFMGSPGQFSWLIDAVYSKGCSAVSLLLPGHGKTARELYACAYTDWEQHLSDALFQYSKTYDKIYIVGHSMGGLLGLNESVNKANNIAGVFLIATPVKLRTGMRSLYAKIRCVSYPTRHPIKQEYLKANGISGLNLFTSLLLLKPSREFIKLKQKTLTNLSQISVPVYMVYSKKDETTAYESMVILDAGLKSENKQTLTLYKSTHAYYEPAEREQLLNALLKFISEL